MGSDKSEVVTGLAFVANEENVQYAGKLSEAETLRLIRAGHGTAGPCTEYVLNTADHLRAAHIRDQTLERLAMRLRS